MHNSSKQLYLVYNLTIEANTSMGRRCVVSSCINSKGKPVDTVHIFPKNNAFQHLRWTEFVRLAPAVNIDQVNLDNFGLCSLHFPLESFTSRSEELSWNKSDAKQLKKCAFSNQLFPGVRLESLDGRKAG